MNQVLSIPNCHYILQIQSFSFEIHNNPKPILGFAKNCNPPFCCGGHFVLAKVLVIYHFIVIRTEFVIQKFSTIEYSKIL